MKSSGNTRTKIVGRFVLTGRSFHGITLPMKNATTANHQFGVRAQGPARLSSVGWKRPLNRSAAWDQVETFRKDVGYTMIEVFNFDLDKNVHVEFPGT